MRTFPPLQVEADEADALRAWAASAGVTAARRTRIVLLSAEGHGPSAVAAIVGCSPTTVLTWRERYRAEGIAGLTDAPRPGRPVTVDPVSVIERTLHAPPPRARRWSSRLLADELGVSNVAVAKIWRTWGISPLDDGHVRLGCDPPLAEVLAAFAGVHVDADAAVLAVVVGDRPPRERTPMGARPRLGGRFGSVDVGASGDPEGLARLLGGLDDVPAGRLRLLAAGDTAAAERWADGRGTPLHVAADCPDWTRFVRVSAVLAGATECGAASVAGLRTAVLAHEPGRALQWVHIPTK
ncbi:helix-turn-helix domain-containing protein [Pseudonocardia abyssalis]|uniref:Helix-turn-helix domain containing protein n=1 Tax=Pseudonocardia abyssalis TaxID=2792008 RepID=A0ABS6UUX4_9PSEU|nr:helix-turn-helix domain-containing protein [Pseudonocardia abyssalis]MBW0117274.1 helix-turn-helix domain containing protein [Pseudonocardia abyssalis]MBW0136032.1 helix-turn-helix domain containing protein [Pseudonocardia abyssalis]